MAFTSTKMSLRVWNLLTDLYDHAQLADNWAKVDYHDHSPGKGVQIPTEGIADAAITSPKLAAALDPNGAYTGAKLIFRGGASQAAAAAAGTYPLLVSPGVSGLPIQANVAALYLDPALWTATGRTVRYLLRGAVITNAVAPTATYSFGVFPVATWGGASGNAPTIATLSTAVAVTGNIVAPAAGAPSSFVDIEFDAPAAGWFSVACVQTGAAAAGAAVGTVGTLWAKQV